MARESLPPPDWKGPDPRQDPLRGCGQSAGVPIEKTVKAIAVIREQLEMSIGIVRNAAGRGDHDLNELKAQKVIGAFRFGRDDEIERNIEVRPRLHRPVSSVPLNLYADRTVAAMSDFVCGETRRGFTSQVSLGTRTSGARSCSNIRKAFAGDPSPEAKGLWKSSGGIEVGTHLPAGTKYSQQ